MGGFVEVVCEDVRFGYSRCGVCTPAYRFVPLSVGGGGIDMDADQDDVVFAIWSQIVLTRRARSLSGMSSFSGTRSCA